MAGGKRAGARPKRRFRPALLLLAVGITLSVVAWGYLVYAAIDFGGEARDGETEAWYWVGVAAVGAAACLFVGLMLVARLSRALGITQKPEKPTKPPKPPKLPEPDPHAAFQRPTDSAPGHRAR
jgi:membrane associated rhomboid family serine protease